MANYIELIEDRFGYDYKKAGGEEIRFCCPYCSEVRGKEDRDYKFYVNIGNLFYYCHKCGTGGRVDAKHRSLTSSEKLDNFLEYKNKMDKYESLKKIISASIEDKNPINWQPLIGYPILKYKEEFPTPYRYLMNRNDITEELILERKFRFLPNIEKGFGGRIIIPNQIRLMNGIYYTDFYQGRAYYPEIQPKYLFSPGVNKQDVCYNIHQIKMHIPALIITEGVFTALSAGRERAVCIYGKYLSNKQRDLILAKKPQSLIVALDYGAEKEAWQIIEQFRNVGYTNLKMVKYPEGDERDANDMGSELFQDLLDNAFQCNNKLMIAINQLGGGIRNHAKG